MIQGAIAALKSAGRGKAVNKRPATEYMFAIDGDKQQLRSSSTDVTRHAVDGARADASSRSSRSTCSSK